MIGHLGVVSGEAAAAVTFKQVTNMNNLVGAYPSDGPGTNSSNGVSIFIGKTQTVAHCQALCANQTDCHSYIWCDGSCRGSYGWTCYKRTDTAWCDATKGYCHEADHTSGQ